MYSLRAFLVLGVVGTLMATACGVPSWKYEAAMTRLKRAQRHLTESQEAHNQTKRKLTELELAKKPAGDPGPAAKREAAALKTRVAELETKLASCKAPAARPVAARPVAPTRPAAPPPPAAAPEPTVSGPLDVAAVKEGMDKIMPRIRKCYERRVLKKGKKITGTLIAKFRIKRGKPRRVKVRKGTFKHRRLQTCVRRAIRKARFTKNRKRTKVTYPLSFAP